MDAIARWVAEVRPEAFVVDVSVEVATFVRLLGVPLIVVALPGTRDDAPHQMVHRMADRIIAPWPQELYSPSWLDPYRDKTAYVGGISRFDGRPPDRVVRETRSSTSVLLLSGAEGMGVDPVRLGACRQEVDDADWTMLGAVSGEWTADPWPQISSADVVVTHAGQNSIADVAAAGRSAVVIPQARPFEEQHTTGAVLDRSGLAVVTPRWPDAGGWPELLWRAQSLAPQWQRWQVRGAAGRAAETIEATTRRLSGRVRR